MDPAVLSQIVEALNTIYDPAASGEQRRSASEFCETVKENQQSPLWGHFLAHKQNGQPEIFRHFGLTLLENAIRYKWNDSSYSDEDRIRLREAVVNLMQTGTADILSEKSYIKEKLAKLFVEVAKRMWPMQWTDMDVLLRRMYTENPTQREFVLLVYKSLAEDIFLFDDPVAGLRKTELVTSMMAVTVSGAALEDLYAQRGTNVNLTSLNNVQSDFEMLLKMMRADPENQGWFQRWTTAAEELHTQWIQKTQRGEQGTIVIEMLCALTLKTLSVQMDWIIPRAIKDSRIMYLLLNLILAKSEPIRDAASDCLLVICSRHFSSSETDENRLGCIWQPFFADGHLEAVILAWTISHGGDSTSAIGRIDQSAILDDDTYTFIKRLTQITVALGEVHITVRKATSTPPILAKYLSLLLLIFDHPSLMIASTAASLWTAELHSVLPRLLDVVAARFCKLGNSVSEAAATYKDMDFDAKDQLDFVSGEFYQRTQTMVSSIAAIETNASFIWIANRIQAMLTSQPDPSSTNGFGFQEPSSPYVQLFEGNCELLGLVIRGSQSTQLMQEGGSERNLISGMMELVEAILSYHTMDPILVQLQLRMVVVFAEVLSTSNSPPLVLRCVQKMSTFITFVMPDEEDFISKHLSIREETRLLRRTACSSLVRLAVAMPDVLINNYEELASAIQRLIAEQRVLRAEQTFLTEFLLSVVFFSRTPVEGKQSVYESLVAPTLCELEEIATSSALSAENLIAVSGLGLLAGNASKLRLSAAELKAENPKLLDEIGSSRGTRGNLLGVVAAIASFLRRTIDTRQAVDNTIAATMWQAFIPRIASCMFTIIRSVHGMWNPILLQNSPPEFAMLFNGMGKDTAIHAGLDKFEDRREERASNELVNQVVLITAWTSSLREHCLQALSLMTYLGPQLYTLPSIKELWIRTLLQPESEIENRHWKAAIVLGVRPFALNCPEQMLAPVLGPVLSAVFEIVGSKLDSEWNQLVDRGIQLGKPDTEDDATGELSEDIRAEKALRDMTRAYADFVMTMLAPASNVRRNEDKKDDPPKPAFVHPNLVNFLLWDPTMTRSILATLTRLISVKDTAAAKKATIACTKLFPTLLSHPEFHTWLGSDLLRAFLEALHDAYHIDMHSEILASIAELYSKLRPLSDAPFHLFASLPGVTAKSMIEFENKLGANNVTKMQSSIVREFLRGITG
ncbi:hypothetical protein PhCBS80983_g00487 [Powellomyces hirtus]|uniref:Uncharacterized protein n=1 Tax=Powellomyces hirtus TaxID=109895 RepID=A0A507EGG8_9FUNG|nr:hypothetical protein PhCBS80983_g00487 [Powellomyces hirtus]